MIDKVDFLGVQVTRVTASNPTGQEIGNSAEVRQELENYLERRTQFLDGLDSVSRAEFSARPTRVTAGG